MKLARKFKADSVYMGRFDFGADIHTQIEAFCARHGIKAAWLNVIGALSRADISYYDQQAHAYHTQTLSGEFEIVSCTGNVSLKDAKPFAHIHIVLSDPQCNTRGGHLMGGSVQLFAGEFVLFALDPADGIEADLERCVDAQTGLALWT